MVHATAEQVQDAMAILIVVVHCCTRRHKATRKGQDVLGIVFVILHTITICISVHISQSVGQ